MTSSHVGGVDVGSFFTVNLYANKGPVKQVCNLLVTEAFVLHYVAPVATGIADAYKKGLVFSFGFVKGFLSPWEPVNRIVSVFEKVGAFFFY